MVFNRVKSQPGQPGEMFQLLLIQKRILLMFQKQKNSGYRQALPGIKLKTLVYGEKTLMSEFCLEKGAQLPRHAHPHEQTGYLVRGQLRLSIGAEVHEVLPGDSWCIPGEVEHGAEILEDSVAIEVFAPRREDYLPD
jgi:quercetin dioxygenase-like cupin family protein